MDRASDPLGGAAAVTGTAGKVQGITRWSFQSRIYLPPKNKNGEHPVQASGAAATANEPREEIVSHGARLHLSQNPTIGDGGTCYGDSGGPDFLGDSNMVAALTVTGDTMCRATNVDYRLDTPSARTFLDDFVTLP